MDDRRRVVVVGSGPAGAMAAHELVRHYTDRVLDFRHQRQQKFDTLLGCRLPAMADVLGRHRDRFLVAYSRQAGWHMDGRFPVFYAYSCLKIARQLCGGTGVLPRPYADEQRRQTSAMLAAGIASLDGGLPGAS